MPYVTGPIIPAGPFYGMQDVYLRGGLRVVANASERDALPVSLRYPGMLALTRDTGALWRLEADNTTWRWVHTGGRKVYAWEAELTVSVIRAAVHDVTLEGDTTLTVTDASAGVSALLYLRNGTAGVVQVDWAGVVWPRNRVKALAPGEEVRVWLLGTGTEIVGDRWRQGLWIPTLPAQDKVLSYWTLDRVTGGVYPDSIGGKDMLPGGFARCPGLVGHAAVQTVQDGTVSTLLRAADAALQLSTMSGFGLRLWFRVFPGSVPERLVTWADNTARLATGDLRVSLTGGNLIVVLFSDATRAVTLPFAPDTWWHRLIITWTSTGSVLKVVLDDASATASPVSLGGANGDAAINLGTITSAGVPGLALDEVVFWKGYALSDEDIDEDWAGGNVLGAVARPAPESGMVAINFEHLLDGAPL